MNDKIAVVLLQVTLNDSAQEVRTPTEAELKTLNLGISAEDLTKVNDSELDIFKIEIVNGLIQVRRLLVIDNDGSDEECTAEDFPHVVSNWELV